MLAGMGSRERPVDARAARAREILGRLPAEPRTARLGCGLSQQDVADAIWHLPVPIQPHRTRLVPRSLHLDGCEGVSILGYALSVRAFPAGDPRAWDATVRGDVFRAGIEAETRFRDQQALDRRLALKERDGGMDRLILVLLDSRSNARLFDLTPSG
jgi:hypothetical protein